MDDMILLSTYDKGESKTVILRTVLPSPMNIRTVIRMTVICIPVAVGQALYRIWIYGEFMCKLTGFLQGVTVAASVFTIALLSVDRFLAIRHPLVFRRLSTNATAIKLLLIVWILAIILMVPLFIIRQISVMDLIPEEPVHFCSEIWSEDYHRQQYDVAQFVVVYIIPGVMICVCYGAIGSELWKEDKDLHRAESETGQGLAKQVMKGRKRVAKMLIALAVLFAVCWLPYHTVSLYLDFHPEENKLLVALPYTIFLGHSNSALNPILYFCSSKSFRGVLFRMFKCKQKPFKQTRRENVVVRCTRNNAGTTTTALTRRRCMRLSSNTSLKSSSGTLRTSYKSTRNSSSNRHNGQYQHYTQSPRNSFKDKLIQENRDLIHKNNDKNKSPICADVRIIEPNEEQNDIVNTSYHKKAFMEATISIPTTINEESSRHNSLVPVPKITPTASMEAIHEESAEVSSANNMGDGNKDSDDIPMLTIAVVTTSDSNDTCSDSRNKSSNQINQLQIEANVNVQ